MRQDYLQIWKNLWVRVVVYTLLLILAYFVLRWGFRGARSAITTIIIAFAFSYLTSPIVRWFEHRRLTRALGVVVVFVGLLLFLGLASVLLANMVVELTRFTTELPALLTPLFNWIQNLPDTIGRIELPQPVRDALQQASSSIQTLLQAFTQTLLRGLQLLLSQGGNLLGFFTSIVGGVFQLLTALTISIYLLYDLPKIAQTLLRFVPQPYQPITLEIAAKADKAFGAFVRGQLTVALCVGTTVGVGLAIVGVPQAASLGFLAAVFNLIPFVGIIISSVPAILLALSGGWLKVALTILVLWLANQLEGNVYGPFIMRRITSIHPVTGISAILIAASLFGFVGALLAGPMTAFLKILYTDYYLNSKFYKDG